MRSGLAGIDDSMERPLPALRLVLSNDLPTSDVFHPFQDGACSEVSCGESGYRESPLQCPYP